jgi:hypothetical protein
LLFRSFNVILPSSSTQHAFHTTIPSLPSTIISVTTELDEF